MPESQSQVNQRKGGTGAVSLLRAARVWPRRRRALLRSGGVRRKDSFEKEECRDIRQVLNFVDVNVEFIAILTLAYVLLRVSSIGYPNTPEYRANELATDQSIDALDTPDGASYSTDSYSENSEEEEDDLSSEEDTNDDTNRIRLQLPSEANNVLAPNALHFNSHSSAHSGTPLAAHHHVNYNALYGVATPASHQIMMNSCPVTQYSANLSQNLSYATVSLMSHNSRIQGDHEYLSLNQSQSTSAQQQLHPNISSSVVVAASTSQSTSLASNNNNNNSHNSHNHNLSNHNLSNHHLNLNVDNSSSSSSNSNSGGGNNNCNSDGQSGGQLHHSQISNNASSEDTFVSEPSPMTGNCSMSR